MSLAELIKRVEGLTGPDRLTDANILWAIDPQAFQSDADDDDAHLKPSYCYARGGWTLNRADRAHLDSIPVPRFTASLDAAMDLVEKCLPGWEWEAGNDAHFGYHAVVYRSFCAGGLGYSEEDMVTAATPAIALVLAAIRALPDGGVDG